jgi:hypothetical protein
MFTKLISLIFYSQDLQIQNLIIHELGYTLICITKFSKKTQDEYKKRQ